MRTSKAPDQLTWTAGPSDQTGGVGSMTRQTLVGRRHGLNPPEYRDLRPLNLHMLMLADTIS